MLLTNLFFCEKSGNAVKSCVGSAESQLKVVDWTNRYGSHQDLLPLVSVWMFTFFGLVFVNTITIKLFLFDLWSVSDLLLCSHSFSIIFQMICSLCLFVTIREEKRRQNSCCFLENTSMDIPCPPLEQQLCKIAMFWFSF